MFTDRSKEGTGSAAKRRAFPRRTGPKCPIYPLAGQFAWFWASTTEYMVYRPACQVGGPAPGVFSDRRFWRAVSGNAIGMRIRRQSAIGGSLSGPKPLKGQNPPDQFGECRPLFGTGGAVRRGRLIRRTILPLGLELPGRTRGRWNWFSGHE